MGAAKSLRDQLGLKLESAKAPSQILVKDRVERPSATLGGGGRRQATNYDVLSYRVRLVLFIHSLQAPIS